MSLLAIYPPADVTTMKTFPESQFDRRWCNGDTEVHRQTNKSNYTSFPFSEAGISMQCSPSDALQVARLKGYLDYPRPCNHPDPDPDPYPS